METADREQNRSLERLDSLLLENIRLLRAIRAENTTNMSALQEEMSIIESILRDSGFKVNSLRDRIESLKDDIDKKASTDTDSSGAEVAPKAEELISTALLDLNQGKYELAIMGFESYLEQFENGSLSDDARYYIGEARFAQSNYTEAALNYLTLTRKWPQSELVPSALYKAGQSYEKLEQEDLAATYYRRLIEGFKSSQEAELAKKRLEELSK